MYKRQIETPASGGGTCEGELSEERICNTDSCPVTPPVVDCSVSDWEEWGDCSATCGGGEQTRKRTIVTPASGGGTCTDTLLETQVCNVQECPVTPPVVDCVLSGWEEWSTCSAECDGGKQERTRSIETPASGGGTCEGELSEERICNTDSCPVIPPVVNCSVSDWEEWGDCNATCGCLLYTSTSPRD